MDKNADRARGVDRCDSADAYEPYVGRWSRLVAREFVQWLRGTARKPLARRWLRHRGACSGGSCACSIPRSRGRRSF